MDDLITIVIPVYNVEKYIHQCLNSVINQSYTNLEIIIVDDGTKDNSGIICDEYASKDKRMKVIHKENAGLSDARNVGINNANGKYITFIDSDDYVEYTYIEELYKAILENNVKLSQCSINIVNNYKMLNTIGYNENSIKNGKELIEDINNGHWTENVVVWNKMYDITLFNTLRYPVGKINEDEFVTYKILYQLDEIALISDKLYNYRKNELSIMGNFSLKRLDILEALEERLVFFKQRSEKELYKLTLKLYLDTIQCLYIKVCKYYKKDKKTKQELYLKYRKSYKLNSNDDRSIGQTMLYYMPNSYIKLHAIIRKNI